MSSIRLQTVLNQMREVIRADGDAVLADAELLERFVRRRDPGAFEILLWRHGPMVLGVCRRILRNEADAEDAFQAVFLALARKAGAIRRRTSLPGWLYHVAYRAACKRRGLRTERARREAAMARPPEPAVCDPFPDTELYSALDREIQRLPTRYRVPFILCLLQGRPTAEIARELGCSRGTILTRLSRARNHLRRRFGQRGISLGAVLGTSFALSSPAIGQPAMPLVFDSLRHASAYAAGAATTTIPTPILTLTEGVLRTMFFAKVRSLLVVLVGAVLICSAASWMVFGGADAASSTAGSPSAVLKAPGDVDPPGIWKPGPGHFTKGIAGTRLAVISSGGGMLATVDRDNTLRVWDIAAEKEKHVLLKGHFDSVNAVAFSPNGKHLIAGVGKCALVWDLDTGKVIKKLRPKTSDAVDKSGNNWDAVCAVGFTSDGKWATLSQVGASWVRFGEIDSKRAELFEDGENQDFVGTYIEGPFKVQMIAASPDRKWVVAVGTNPPALRARSDVPLMRTVDRKDGKAVAGDFPWDGDGYHCAAFSGDSKLLAAGGLDKKVYVYDVAERKRLFTLEAHQGEIRCLAFAPDHQHLATGAADDSVIVWEARTGKSVAKLEGWAKGAKSLEFTTDGKELIGVGIDGSVKTWELKR